MRHRTSPQANPVRQIPRREPAGVTPRIGFAVVTPTSSADCRADWRVAAFAFAVTLAAVVAVSL